MGIVLKILKINGERTEKVENYTTSYSYDFLYPNGTTRDVKKFYLFPLGARIVTQVASIEYVKENAADVVHYNKWRDI